VAAVAAVAEAEVAAAVVLGANGLAASSAFRFCVFVGEPLSTRPKKSFLIALATVLPRLSRFSTLSPIRACEILHQNHLKMVKFRLF
jgi:hypothetical protein